MTTALVETRAPDLAALIPIVTDTLGSPHSRRAYAHYLSEFLAWCGPRREPFSRGLVMSYRALLVANGAGSARVNLALNAIRKLALEAADRGLMDPGAAAAIAKISGIKQRGRRTGYWLTLEQARALLELSAGTGPRQARNRVILALLMGCGLRRQEACDLSVGQVQQRDGRAVLVDLRGKGEKLRTVPMPAWAAEAVENWLACRRVRALDSAAPLLCPIAHIGKDAPMNSEGLNSEGRPEYHRLNPANLHYMVVNYGRKMGLELTPHDLRRTFAKLALAGDAKLEQIQVALGHSSLVVTQRYLGVDLDLRNAACDVTGLAPISLLGCENSQQKGGVN